MWRKYDEECEEVVEDEEDIENDIYVSSCGT